MRLLLKLDLIKITKMTIQQIMKKPAKIKTTINIVLFGSIWSGLDLIYFIYSLLGLIIKFLVKFTVDFLSV